MALIYTCAKFYIDPTKFATRVMRYYAKFSRMKHLLRLHLLRRCVSYIQLKCATHLGCKLKFLSQVFFKNLSLFFKFRSSFLLFIVADKENDFHKYKLGLLDTVALLSIHPDMVVYFVLYF